jgi:hypothetical protein
MINKKQKLNSWKLTAVVAAIMFLFSSLAQASEISPFVVIKLVNDARSAQGLAGLKENETLDKIATDKLNDMISHDYFAHTSPQGVNPWFWYEKNGYDYKYAGENLAINFLVAEDEQKAWMNSPTHRKNILNVNYQEIGVAVGAGKINGQTSIIAVQEFGSRVGAGNVPTDGKNFSGKGSEGPIKDSMGIPPQVLSVKNLTEENLKNNSVTESKNSYFQDLMSKWDGKKYEIGYGLSQLAAFLMIISLFLSSTTFMAVAVNDIMKSEELRRQALKNALGFKGGHGTLAT